MSTSPPCKIEILGRAHIRTAIDMAAAEGWNPGLADAQTFHDADPQAFTGCVTEDGQLLACISITRYSAETGFLGFYICAPEWRGQRIGLTVWQAALDRVGPISLALDGVVDQQENYRQSGFVYAHPNLRYGGMAADLGEVGDVCSLAECDPVALAAFDTAVFGIARPRFLAAWLAQEGATTACILDGTRVRGYGLCRPCQEGCKIGPLFADDEHTARALFTALARGVDGPVFLDIPGPNAAAGQLARDAGLSPVFETARMIKGGTPKPDLRRTYGITSFEFG